MSNTHGLKVCRILEVLGKLRLLVCFIFALSHLLSCPAQPSTRKKKKKTHPVPDRRAAFLPEIHHVIELFGVGNRSVTCSCFMLQHTVNCHSLTNLSLPLFFIFCPLSLTAFSLTCCAAGALRKRLALVASGETMSASVGLRCSWLRGKKTSDLCSSRAKEKGWDGSRSSGPAR